MLDEKRNSARGNAPVRRLADLDGVLTFRLARLQNRLNAQAAAVLGGLGGPSLTQWRLLTAIHTLGETTLSEIVRELRFDKGQVSRALTAMMGRGWVLARPDPDDQRRQILALTSAGITEHTRLLGPMRARQAALAKSLSGPEQAGLLAGISAIEAALDDP
ncbi:MAG: MarR family transcriptional regulator [Pseudomonadota bacterium]